MMKNFTLLLAFLFLSGSFYTVQAQHKMEIYAASNDELIPNGSNLFSIAASTSKIILTDSLYVKNISNETINVKVRKYDYKVSVGTLNDYWALAQYIEPDQTTTPNYWELESDAYLPREAYFQGQYRPQNIISTSSVMYSFLALDNNDQIIDSVYVIYAFSNTSITPTNENNEALYNKEILVNVDPSETSEYAINIHNHSSEAVSIRVNKNTVQIEEGHETSFKFGGTDYPMGENSSEASGEFIEADETLEGEDGFIAYFNPNGIDGNEFLTTIEYKFFNKVAGNDSETITFLYNPTSVGLINMEGYSVSNAYPNPATNQFNIDYDIPDFNEASLKVYHSNGALIGRFPISSYSGTLTVSTSRLSSGIYFYSLEVDGKHLGVQKVMVK